MSRVIDFSLSNSSIASAVSQLYFEADEVARKGALFVRELANIGESVASANFGSGATISVSIRDDGFEIHALGKAVCFLEFGAGTMAGSGVPLGEYQNITVDVRPGSWSEEHAKQFSTYGKWIFGGREYTFVVPRMGMYKATKEIIDKIYDVARSVFS